jgi:hypothetical protein
LNILLRAKLTETEPQVDKRDKRDNRDNRDNRRV